MGGFHSGQGQCSHAITLRPLRTRLLVRLLLIYARIKLDKGRRVLLNQHSGCNEAEKCLKSASTDLKRWVLGLFNGIETPARGSEVTEQIRLCLSLHFRAMRTGFRDFQMLSPKRKIPKSSQRVQIGSVESGHLSFSTVFPPHQLQYLFHS